jgi:outer membrane protein insertion porin family
MVLSMLFAASWTVQAAPEGAADPATDPAATTAANPTTPAPSAKPEDLIGKKVAFIEVAGAVNIKPETILALTRLKPGDEWTPDKVRQDLRMIYEMGTFADVTADFAAIPEGVKVIYHVKENPILKGIVLQGNNKLSKDKLLKLMTVKTGEVLNSKTVAANLRAIEESYKAEGYILAKTGDINFSPEGILTVRVNEGIVEDIVVKGNTKSKPFVITREMRTKKGQPFNAKEARVSMQKLYNLGYFEDVNLKLLPGKQPGGTIIEVAVSEQKTGTFSIGGGYSASDGLIGIINVGDKNFRGRGDDVNIHWEFGGKASTTGNYSVSFRRPWLDRKQTSFAFTFYNMLNQYTDYNSNGDELSTYDRRYRGFDFTFGRPVNDKLSHFITFKNRWDEYGGWVSGKNYETDEPYKSDNYIHNNFGLTRSIIVSRVLDTRDSNTNPSEGSRYALSGEFAGLGGDFSFNKYTAEGRRYWKVGKSQVVAIRGMYGYGTGHIPEMQKYMAGGIDTLRGYRDDQFKGNRLFAATAEYRFPVAKRVMAALFADAGNAWDSSSFDFIKDLKFGYGLGIRIVTPFGPMRVDYGIGSQGGRTHFSFGGQF